MCWIGVMRQILTTKKLMSGSVLLLFSAGLAGCINTATYGTGESPELSIIKGVTSGLSGADRSKREKIDYSPRAPLVIPPEANLRTPAEPAAETNPDWPVEAGAPGTEVEDPLTQSSRADPDYVRRLQPLVGTLPADERPASYDMEQAVDQAHLEGLRDRGARKKFKAALDDAEGYNSTERRYLTDPPQTYRQPAESAPQEFEDIEPGQGSFFAKLFNWRNREK